MDETAGCGAVQVCDTLGLTTGVHADTNFDLAMFIGTLEVSLSREYRARRGPTSDGRYG